MIRKWTKSELARALELRLQGNKWAEIAAALGRSETSLWVKLSQLEIKLRANGSDEESVRANIVKLHHELLQASAQEVATPQHETEADEPADPAAAPVKTMADTTLEEDVEESRRRLVFLEAQESNRKYKEALHEKALEERLLDIFRERIQPFSLPATPAVSCLYPVPAIGRKLEAAVLLVGDTHIGQVVSPIQTSGFGVYNPRIYCERLHYMQEKVVQLLGEMPPGFDELHIVLLGDILHGALNHHAEKEDTLAIADQFQLAIWTLHQFIAALALRVPSVFVHTVVGNHGRWPGQRKMPTTYRYSNLDHLVYSSLQMTLLASGLTNVSMRLNAAPRQLIEIKGSRFQASHGDHLKGGDKQFGIPIHSATRDVNATSQRYAAADDRGIDYFLCGDKHRSISLPLARGEYIINGSLVGVDEFAMAFSPGEAMQLLFGVDAILRKTWSYPIKAKNAPALRDCPYHLPEQIRYLVEPDDHGRLAA